MHLFLVAMPPSVGISLQGQNRIFRSLGQLLEKESKRPQVEYSGNWVNSNAKAASNKGIATSS